MIQLNKRKAHWFAVSTRYKCEKYVQKMLSDKSIQAYVPLQKRYRIWGGRRRVVDMPLISCYVFVKIKHDEYVSVLETDNVLKFVKIVNKLAVVSEEEINILQRVVGDMELDVSVKPLRFEVGDKVEIIQGTLIGTIGKLVETGKNKFIVIELQNIGYSLRINVQNNKVRKV